MQTLRNKLIAIAAVATLGLIGSFMSPRGAVAAPASAPNNQPVTPVSIVNPVPVPVSGTIATTQSGAWNVGLTGTPSVSIGNAPAVHLDSAGALVTIPNPATPGVNAVQVRDVNNATQSIWITCDTAPSTTAGVFCPYALYMVPAGKVLIIEYASATCGVPAGQAIALELFSSNLTVFTPLSSPAPAGSSTFAQVGQLVKAYLSHTTGDGNLFASVSRTDTSGPAFACEISITGHLVDVP